MKKSRIKKMEWVALYVLFGIVDLIQLLITLTGIGIAINEIADPIIGGIILAYFQLRGVSMIKRPSRVISLFGVLGLETITGGIAPAWIVDIWLIQRSVMQEDAEIDSVNIIKTTKNSKPLYQNGKRMPTLADEDNEGNGTPLNEGGYRLPRGGLK